MCGLLLASFVVGAGIPSKTRTLKITGNFPPYVWNQSPRVDLARQIETRNFPTKTLVFGYRFADETSIFNSITRFYYVGPMPVHL